MPGLEKFKLRFREKYGADFLIFAPFDHDAVLVLAEAMKAANSTELSHKPNHRRDPV